jgi:crotonobetainyl-CoA:carnitine CoA-transferase CaiB-like acyl-CoA transferase
MQRPELSGPLKGIKILDLTRLLPGPLGTQMMAEMGAEVWKIEDKNAPDYARFMPPHLGSTGAIFEAVNRTKRSILVDLKTEEGKHKFFSLLTTADIVIEGFRPGIIDKMGIGYDIAKTIKPDIIYVSVTGYGQDGPYKNKAGHDLNYISYAGVLGLNGGNIESPSLSSVQIADIAGGTYPLIIGALAALWARTYSGIGQKVDISMTDCVLPLASVTLGESLNSGKPYRRGTHPLGGSIPNYNIYKCKDEKWIALGALEPKFWMGFCAAIHKPEWVSRIMEPALYDSLVELFLSKNRSEWLQTLEHLDICFSPIHDQEEVISDPQLLHRNMFIEIPHTELGSIKGIAQPIKFSGTPCQTVWSAPKLGEDDL